MLCSLWLPVVLACACAGLLLADQVMYWQSSFPSITLSPLADRAAVVSGTATARLILTGDVELTADNGPAACLTGPGGAALITEYGLSFDGDGQNASGAAGVPYASYENFLRPSVLLRHVVGDDDVVVTLQVRARMPTGNPADSGSYRATQTITATWAGP